MVAFTAQTHAMSDSNAHVLVKSQDEPVGPAKPSASNSKPSAITLSFLDACASSFTCF